MTYCSQPGIKGRGTVAGMVVVAARVDLVVAAVVAVALPVTRTQYESFRARVPPKYRNLIIAFSCGMIPNLTLLATSSSCPATDQSKGDSIIEAVYLALRWQKYGDIFEPPGSGV